MKLLDLKYTLVKNDETGEVEGFMSIMPTYENDDPVLYVYEIHLSPDLQGYVYFFSLLPLSVIKRRKTNCQAGLVWE